MLIAVYRVRKSARRDIIEIFEQTADKLAKTHGLGKERIPVDGIKDALRICRVRGATPWNF